MSRSAGSRTGWRSGNPRDTDSALGGAALPGCVQVDLFGANYGNLPLDHQAMTDFLRVNTWSRTSVEETIVSGFVSGDAFNLTGAGVMAVVAGAEYRSTKAAFEVDNDIWQLFYGPIQLGILDHRGRLVRSSLAA